MKDSNTAHSLWRSGFEVKIPFDEASIENAILYSGFVIF
jgi:hypothetical protein